MITDINLKKVYTDLNRERLPDYWNAYFLYQAEAPDLYEITQRELEREVQAARNTERPFVDSQVVVGAILNRLGNRHNFHRQFNERFPELHREQILGMQLYTIMLHDEDTWIYTETQHAGHMFPHATYFMPKNSA